MALINISANLNEVQSEFPILAPGEVKLKYELPKLDNSKNSGKPVLRTRLVNVGPVKDENGKEIAIGRFSVMESITLDPNAPFTIKNRLLATKVPFTVTNNVTQFDPDHFLGKEVICRVSIYEKDGKRGNNVVSTRAV